MSPGCSKKKLNELISASYSTDTKNAESLYKTGFLIIFINVDFLK